MDIILIRHGTKIPTSPDKDAPLAPEGLAEIDHLKERMTRLGINPAVYLTSKYKRAKQTAERLAFDASLIHTLNALTPDTDTFSSDAQHMLTSISAEAKKQNIDLNQQAVIAIVGHEPQLSTLLRYMTSKLEIGKGSGVPVKADSFDALIKGKGTL
ncbi:SixA phosphatase family protein [Ktedonospora formicarum]|uniref:Phosphohistidine phosphatase SixA n=1 Tax=Ktedonospora formicarum TaxID=2778364 RepID=A0A8J3I484_9CHLR|nr:histidine phosphatase family protein [Ktedonospora formicarum]GHO49922.1 phosphohistidine phosphatase SixA [Ktedonospora formicarum]